MFEEMHNGLEETLFRHWTDSFIYFIYIVLEGQINFQPRSQALVGAGHVTHRKLMA